jgi:IclR family pca regulon transcriptional regulator
MTQLGTGQSWLFYMRGMNRPRIVRGWRCMKRQFPECAEGPVDIDAVVPDFGKVHRGLKFVERGFVRTDPPSKGAVGNLFSGGFGLSALRWIPAKFAMPFPFFSRAVHHPTRPHLYQMCDNRPVLKPDSARASKRAPRKAAEAAAPEFANHAGNPDFMLSLARGLCVIESFENHPEGRSIVEIARATGLSRAAIRRILLTLELLGYVEHSRQVYRLTTQVLRLGFSFLSSSTVVEAARPVLERISEQLHESSSMSMLDGEEIVYVARSAASRILAAGLSVGSRLPAYCTSMGRVLLAALPDDRLDDYLRNLKPKAYTPKTITRIVQLKKAIHQVRKNGYAIVDEELEAGLRSIAVPVLTRSNHVVAAINVGTHTSRVDRPTLTGRCLPALREGARTLHSVLI